MTKARRRRATHVAAAGVIAACMAAPPAPSTHLRLLSPPRQLRLGVAQPQLRGPQLR